MKYHPATCLVSDNFNYRAHQERRSFISDGKRSRRVAFADEVTEGAGSKDQVQVQEAGEESTQEQADTPPPKKAKTTSVWDLLL